VRPWGVPADDVTKNGITTRGNEKYIRGGRKVSNEEQIQNGG